MHKEILNEAQIKMLPLLKSFSGKFGLVGGTAIALQLGHRRSIDFDLFTNKLFDHDKIRNDIRKLYEIQSTIVESPEELTVVANDVKLTFLLYPFEINYSEMLDEIINMPSVLTLSAMKAFALGKRAKWKDYVDLFFVLRDHSLETIISTSKGIFGKEFNTKLFREQLSYYQDIDYSEAIDYFGNKAVADNKIKTFLSEISLH